MTRVKEIVAIVGAREISAALNVGQGAVYTSISRTGKFPAKWYPVIKKLCENQGIHCADSLFTFMTPKKII